MRPVSELKLWLAALVLAGAALRCAAQPRPGDLRPQRLTVVARSALVTLEAAAAPAGLTLELRRASDQRPLRAADLTVSVEGKNEPATARGDGSWSVALERPVAAGDRLEVVVAHDGIREVLGGRFAAPGATGPASPPVSGTAPEGSATAHAPRASPAGAVASFWRDHKQMAWWILNIAIVLIAAIAISRRMP